jgi:hypothetical protein
VYAATVDELLVLAGQTLRVLSSVPGAGPSYAFGLCADPIGGRLYVVDAGHARLAVIDQQ